MLTSRRKAINENISTYGDSTRDYTVFAAWEAATDIDLVAAAQSEILECYDDADSFDDYLTLLGATCSSSFFRIVRPAKGQGHDGTPNNGFTVISTINASIFVIQESYSQVQDIVAKLDYNSVTQRQTFKVSAANAGFIGCIAYDSINAGSGMASGFRLEGTVSNYVINCLACNCQGNGFETYGFGSYYFYNCTAIGNNIGFVRNFGTAYAKNCSASANISDDWSGTWVKTTSTVEGATPIYVDSVNNNFHLASDDSVCRDNGTDLSSDGIFAFDDDIDFYPLYGLRSGTWDIGFDEFLAPVFVNTTTPSSGDVAIIWNSDLMFGDIGFENNDLKSDAGLETAVIISLFTDRRARSDDVLINDGEYRGWWGDLVLPVEEDDRIGSRLWLLGREKTVEETLIRAEGYTKEALQWMIDDNVVAKINIFVERQGPVESSKLALKVELLKADGNIIALKYDAFWDAQSLK